MSYEAALFPRRQTAPDRVQINPQGFEPALPDRVCPGVAAALFQVAVDKPHNFGRAADVLWPDYRFIGYPVCLGRRQQAHRRDYLDTPAMPGPAQSINRIHRCQPAADNNNLVFRVDLSQPVPRPGAADKLGGMFCLAGLIYRAGPVWLRITGCQNKHLCCLFLAILQTKLPEARAVIIANRDNSLRIKPNLITAGKLVHLGSYIAGKISTPIKGALRAMRLSIT